MNTRIYRAEHSGFTLIELVVASTVASILMASVYFAFNTTVRSWRQGEANLVPYQEGRNALTLMRRELLSTYEGERKVFQGGSDELLFLTVSSPMSPREKRGPVLLAVLYRLENTVLRRYEAVVGIYQQASTPQSLRPNGEPDLCEFVENLNWDPQGYDLVQDVRDLRFTYWRYPVSRDPDYDHEAPTDPGSLRIDTNVDMVCNQPFGVGIALSLNTRETDGSPPQYLTTFETLVRLNLTMQPYKDVEWCESYVCPPPI